MRSLVVSTVAAIALLAIIAQVGMSHRQALDESTRARMESGIMLDAGISSLQGLALAKAAALESDTALAIVHPPAGAVYPASFPPPRIQWRDAQTSRVYRVTVKQGGQVRFVAVTKKREIRLNNAGWETLRKAGGELSVEIASAPGDADGTQGELVAAAAGRFVVAPPGDNPTGMLLFGAKHRPADTPIGTVSLLTLHLQIEGFDLEQQKHRVLFRSSHGPQKTTVHPGRMERDGGGDEPGRGPNSESQRGEGDAQDPGNDSRRSGAHGDEGNREVTSTQCVSCHAVSSNGKHIAVFSQTAEEAPPEFDAPNGFLTVLSMPERKVVIQLPHAFMPQFNPQNPDLLAFGEVDETIGVKDQMMVRKSDIHVLDLTTGKHFPLPGADLKDRVENLPYWSPDGKRLLFIRTQPGQMWHGAAGHLDVASIPFNNGKGGLAEPLKGASSNGRSNFLPVYSPDGRWVVFTQADQGFFSQESSDLWIVPAAGGTARRMNCNSSHTESWHRFSPDGKWLAMVTNREDIRRPHIYISRFDSETGECKPAVQMPFVSGPGAHTHAFSWTPRFDWLTDYEQVSQN